MVRQTGKTIHGDTIDTSYGAAAASDIGRRIAILNSGIGYQILSSHTDRILDTGYRISESDIIRQMIKKLLDGSAKLKQDCLISDIRF